MEIWCARPATLMIRAAHLRAATLMNRASHLRAATLMIRASHLRAVIVIKLLRWDLICTRACSDIDDPRIIFACSDIDDPRIKFVLHDCNQIANMRLDLCVILCKINLFIRASNLRAAKSIIVSAIVLVFIAHAFHQAQRSFGQIFLQSFGSGPYSLTHLFPYLFTLILSLSSITDYVDHGFNC